jgi:CRISPR/Cas system-associated exonuclease Cas4 (RecB family)
MSIVKNIHRVSHGDLNIDKLISILEEGYGKYQTEKFTQKKSFSPSKLVYGHGACPRYWYIAFEGAIFIESPDAESVANMKNGIASHERLEEVFKNSSVDVLGTEVELFNEDPPIFGYIDVIIDRAGEEVIAEIKTSRTEAFKSRRASGKPPAYHTMQLLIYMHVRDVKTGFLLYEDKNDHSLLVIPVYMTEENQQWVDDAFGWMREVRKSWVSKKLPARAFRRNSKECKGCPVFKTCYEQYEDGDVEIESLRQL